MIELTLPAIADAERPFVTRVRRMQADADDLDAVIWQEHEGGLSFAGPHGLVAIDGVGAADLDGDVVFVDPHAGKLERLIRTGSPHNTLLATERCDQLCIMCSQPPKKTHVDRFDLFEEACLLAEPDSVIGISGGEPTLYKERLFDLIERVLDAREDLHFHILSNAQHFVANDIERLRDARYQRVTWGVPLYASDPALHDFIVGKEGAFALLEESLAYMALAGARVELRTVVVTPNFHALAALAQYISTRLRFIDTWSIMQLENIGFARNRWQSLYVDHSRDFGPIAHALTQANLTGIPARLFNFPRCTVPEPYRYLAAASISDWKRKYVPECAMCSERDVCTGFFEWHPAAATNGVHPL